MAKLFALGAYVYQAALAFGLLFAVAHVLSPSDYGAYSIFISTTQFGAVALFEWIKFACSRFYPGVTPGSEETQRRAILTEALLSTGFCLVVSIGGVLFGMPVWLALVGGSVAVLQGASDLHFTMLRFRQSFRAFSWLQGCRATILAIGTLVGAIFGGTFELTIWGLLAGYLAYAVIAFAFDGKQLLVRGSWNVGLFRQHFVYGSVAAGSALLGLLAPLVLKLTLTSALGVHGAAGVLLALDLLQRPFILIFAALQSIQYPDIVLAHDGGTPKSAIGRLLGQYYALLIIATLIVTAGVLAILWPIMHWLVAPELQAGFIETAPLVLAFAALRGLTQNMSTTPAHLNQNLWWLIGLALADCVVFNALAFAGAQFFGGTAVSIVAGALLGAVIIGTVGVRLWVSLPFRMPMAPVAVAVGAVVLSAGALLVPLGTPLMTSLLAASAAGLVGLAALFMFFVAMRKVANAA